MAAAGEAVTVAVTAEAAGVPRTPAPDAVATQDMPDGGTPGITGAPTAEHKMDVDCFVRLAF